MKESEKLLKRIEEILQVRTDFDFLGSELDSTLQVRRYVFGFSSSEVRDFYAHSIETGLKDFLQTASKLDVRSLGQRHKKYPQSLEILVPDHPDVIRILKDYLPEEISLYL